MSPPRQGACGAVLNRWRRDAAPAGSIPEDETVLRTAFEPFVSGRWGRPLRVDMARSPTRRGTTTDCAMQPKSGNDGVRRSFDRRSAPALLDLREEIPGSR